MLATFLLIFLSGCCLFQEPDAWRFHHVAGICPSFESAKIVFVRRTALDAVDLEMTRGASGLRTYVNLHFCPLILESEDVCTAPLEYSIEEATYKTTVQVFEGGQHLLLPDEDAQAIIAALLSDLSVEIRIDQYQATISPSNFACCYANLLNY